MRCLPNGNRRQILYYPCCFRDSSEIRLRTGSPAADGKVTPPGTAPSGIKTPRTGGIDRWISRPAAATVAGLAGIAGALSYSHMRQLAQDHGQAGWHAHAFPLSVDGLEVVASLVLLAEHRARRPAGCRGLRW